MSNLQQICYNAAGIDLGSERFYIGLPDGSVRNFSTFTSEMRLGISLLKEHGVTTVAMESTGVYGVILHEMIEAEEIEVFLVNPAHVKHVPGRKTDVQDCQWLQQLHSYGLLPRSFIPPTLIKELRSYVRLREGFIAEQSSCIQRIQKALTLMNIRLHQVISQIHGVSGMKVIKAIMAGQRDSQKLLELCDLRIVKNKKEEVLASLEGHYKAEHLFALQKQVDCYEFYGKKIAQCDKKIDQQLMKMNSNKQKPKNLSKAKPIRHHKPAIKDYHEKMVMLMENKEITTLPAITDYNLMQIAAEVGTDLSAWPTEKQFTSWLGLSPGKHSSGKSNKKPKKKPNPRAGLIFREAAQALINSKNIALGHFARRLRARKGSYIAIKATARKLAELFYRAVTKGLEYVEKGIEKYELQIKQTQLKSLMNKARELNMVIIPAEIEHETCHW